MNSWGDDVHLPIQNEQVHNPLRKQIRNYVLNLTKCFAYHIKRKKALLSTNLCEGRKYKKNKFE